MVTSEVNESDYSTCVGEQPIENLRMMMEGVRGGQQGGRARGGRGRGGSGGRHQSSAGRTQRELPHARPLSLRNAAELVLQPVREHDHRQYVSIR